MFMTQTEVDAVQKYVAMSRDRIALGSMMDSVNCEQYLEIYRIAELAVRNAKQRNEELHQVWLVCSDNGRKQIEADVESGEYAKRMNYVDFWHPVMKYLK